jgi:hypothetical protein
MKKPHILLLAILFSFNANAQWNFVTTFYSHHPDWSGNTLTDFLFLNDSTGIFCVNSYSGPGTTSTENDLFTEITTAYGYTVHTGDFQIGGAGYFPWIVERLGQSDTIIRSNALHFDLSVDTGVSWMPFITPSGDIEQFDFLNSSNGIIYSNYSPEKMFLYKNGSLITLPSPSSGGFTAVNDIEMVSTSTIFMISNSNTRLIVSHDTGYTWTTLIDTTMLLNHIEFTNPLTGYISCNNGNFFKTIDGGASWTLLNTGVIYNLN